MFTAILVVALAAAACGSSEPETVTSAAPADESPPTTVEADAPDGLPDGDGEVSDSGESGSSGSDDSGESGSSGDEDLAASSSSSSDDADSAYSDEDSGVSTSSSSGDAGASSGSLDDAVSVTSDEVGDDGADISDPGPSNSGEPVPPLDQRKLAHITDVAFQVLESWPAQVIVEVSGELPDLCHHLWWEVDVDGNTYDVQVWQVSPPPGADIACAQVVEPFTENVPLGGGFVDDEYTVIVNGQPHSLTF